jgi:hypothetical protein
MAINYSKRLESLQRRKFETVLNESLTAKSFGTKEIPENVKYLLESMRPIGKKYNARTLEASDKAESHLENNFNLHFSRAYRRQGSVETDTNIQVHSDIDLLTIIDRYYFLHPNLPNDEPYTLSDPDEDIKKLRSQAFTIFSKVYDEVDNSNEKCISIYNKNLKRKVDIVFGYWYHTEDYERTKDEYYRGVKLKSRSAMPDYPFAHIQLINAKGDNTLDGSRMAIRLLKTLRADCDKELKLIKSFQLTSVVHAIDNQQLFYEKGMEIDIAKAVSNELEHLISDTDYRRSIKSPNGCETPFWDSDIVPEFQLLKTDLDELITDSTMEISKGLVVKNAIKLYS